MSISLSLPVLDSSRSYHRVAKLIETEILEGRVAVGDILPTESDLAAQLGVHRSTVREGLRALEGTGLLRRVRGKRLMVSAPDPSQVAWNSARALGLSSPSFSDLWEVQLHTEPFSARLAAARADGDNIQALRRNLQRTAEHLDDDYSVITADIEFHSLIAEATGNAALVLAVAPINKLLFAATLDLYRLVKPARHRLLEAHRQIVEAVAAGDSRVAEEWMARHIHDFRRGYEVGGLDMNAAFRIGEIGPARGP